jgi:hypothetical protein
MKGKTTMTHELQPQSTATDPSEFKMPFGRPAVLSSESVITYDAIVARFLECIKPRDFIENMFVNDVIDFTWDVLRYTRHKMLTMERQFSRRLEYQANQAKLQAQRKEAVAQRTQTANAPTTVLDRMIELEQVVFDSPNDVAAILKRTPNELDHARGLEDSIEYHERLDRLQGIAVARRNDALQQISLYRQGLGQNLRQVSDEIIDAEFSESKTDGTPLVPTVE